MMEVNACRKAFPSHYIKVNAFDSTRGLGVAAAVVHRQPAGGRARLPRSSARKARAAAIRYTIESYAVDRPEGSRY